MAQAAEAALIRANCTQVRLLPTEAQDAGGDWALPSFVGIIIGYLLLLVFESILFRVFLVGFNSGGLIKWWQEQQSPGLVESSQAYLHFSTLSVVAMFVTGAILTFSFRDPDFSSTVFMDRYGYNHVSVIFTFAPAAQVAPSFWLVSAYGFLRFSILDAQRLCYEIHSIKRNCCLASLVANGFLAMIVVIFATTLGDGSVDRVLTHEGPYLLLVLIFPIIYAFRCWELSFVGKPSCLNVLVSGFWLFVSIVYALALVAARTGSVKADLVRPFDYIWLVLAAVCPFATRWPRNNGAADGQPPASDVIVPADSPGPIIDEGYRVVQVKPATPATADTSEDRDSREVPSSADGSGEAMAFAATPEVFLHPAASSSGSQQAASTRSQRSHPPMLASPPIGSYNLQNDTASAPMAASAAHDDSDTRTLLDVEPPGVVAKQESEVHDDIECQVLPEENLVPAVDEWPLPDSTAGDLVQPIVGIPVASGTPQTCATSLAAARYGESDSQAMPETEPPAAACTHRSASSETSHATASRLETALSPGLGVSATNLYNTMDHAGASATNMNNTMDHAGASATNMYNTMDQLDYAAAVVGSAMGNVLSDDIDSIMLPPEDNGPRPEGSAVASGR